MGGLWKWPFSPSLCILLDLSPKPCAHSPTSGGGGVRWGTAWHGNVGEKGHSLCLCTPTKLERQDLHFWLPRTWPPRTPPWVSSCLALPSSGCWMEDRVTSRTQRSLSPSHPDTQQGVSMTSKGSAVWARWPACLLSVVVGILLKTSSHTGPLSPPGRGAMESLIPATPKKLHLGLLCVLLCRCVGVCARRCVGTYVCASTPGRVQMYVCADLFVCARVCLYVSARIPAPAWSQRTGGGGETGRRSYVDYGWTFRRNVSLCGPSAGAQP